MAWAILRALQTRTSPAITRAHSRGSRCLVSTASPISRRPASVDSPAASAKSAIANSATVGACLAGDLQLPVGPRDRRVDLLAGVQLRPGDGELELPDLRLNDGVEVRGDLAQHLVGSTDPIETVLCAVVVMGQAKHQPPTVRASKALVPRVLGILW